MSETNDLPRLSNETVAYLLTILRNATTPLTTADLVEALKRQTSR